jgi:hypothetical protein
MRSFLEYRKNKLQSKISEISIQEAVTGYFDILRLDLLETVKLPELLFEGSLITESAYNAARKEDYADNKEIIELIVSESKGNFCSRLFNEDIASNLPIDAFVDEIKQLIQGEVETLKQQVATALNASRPTGPEPEAGPEADPAAAISWKDRPISGGQIGALSYYAKKHGAKLPPNAKNMTQGQASNLITQFEKQYGPLPNRSGAPSGPTGGTPAAAPNVSNGDDLDVGDEPMNRSASGATSSVSASGAGPKPFVPAPRGNIRPSDGFLQGLKRTVWDPVAGWAKDKWRNFRRRWHNDPLREHQSFLETIFLENYGELGDVIDNFGKALTDMLVKRVRAYVAGTTGKPASATSTKDGVPTSVRSGSQTTTKKPPANDEKDSNVQEPETVDMARAVAPEAEAEAEAEEEAGEKTETAQEVRYKNGARLGAADLDITIEKDRSTTKYLDSSGNELGRDEIIELLFDKFLESPSQEYRDEVRTSKRHVVNLKKKRFYVAKWLGIPDPTKEQGGDRPLAGYKKSIPRLLFNFYVKQQEKLGNKIVELPNVTRKDKSGETASAAGEKPASPQNPSVTVRDMGKTKAASTSATTDEKIDPKTGFPKDPVELVKKIAEHPTLSQLPFWKNEVEQNGLDNILTAIKQQRDRHSPSQWKGIVNQILDDLQMTKEQLLQASLEQAGEDAEKKKLNPAPEKSPAAASEEKPSSKPDNDQKVAVEPRTEQSDAWRTDPVAFLNKIKEIPSLLRDANEHLSKTGGEKAKNIDDVFKQIQGQEISVEALEILVGVKVEEIEEATAAASQKQTQKTAAVTAPNNAAEKGSSVEDESKPEEEKQSESEPKVSDSVEAKKGQIILDKAKEFLKDDQEKYDKFEKSVGIKGIEALGARFKAVDLEKFPIEKIIEKIKEDPTGQKTAQKASSVEPATTEEENEVAPTKSKDQIILDKIKEYCDQYVENSAEGFKVRKKIITNNKKAGLAWLEKNISDEDLSNLSLEEIGDKIDQQIHAFQLSKERKNPVEPEAKEETEAATASQEQKEQPAPKKPKKPAPKKPKKPSKYPPHFIVDKNINHNRLGKLIDKANLKLGRKGRLEWDESAYDDKTNQEIMANKDLLEELLSYRREQEEPDLDLDGMIKSFNMRIDPKSGEFRWNKKLASKEEEAFIKKNREKFIDRIGEIESEKSMRAEGFASMLNRFRELIRS